MSHSPSMTMRLRWQLLAFAIIFFATPPVAGQSDAGRLNETKGQEPDADIFALMSGRCSTLKIACRDFACRAVAFFHSGQVRTNVTLDLDHPPDDNHVVPVSVQNG